MLGLTHLVGQLIMLATLYYTVFSTSVWAGAALVVGHGMFEVTSYFAKQRLLKEINQFSPEALEEMFIKTKGNC